MILALPIIGKLNYFSRLALEVGYLDFLSRYILRGFHKITKSSQQMTLFNKTQILLPYDSKFGTELFLKRSKLDWGSEKLLVQFLDSKKAL